MNRFYSYLNSATAILKQYKGEEPFASFLKKYFSLHKKHGSGDRKHISHLCYCYFRLGKLETQRPIEERLLLGLFLCSSGTNEVLQHLKPEWSEQLAKTVAERLLYTGVQNAEDIFPFSAALSEGIESDAFAFSHLTQPDLFLRLRPGKDDLVKQKLANAGIDFKVITGNCLALPNASKVDSIVELNKEAVVQDLSSQRVGDMMVAALAGNAVRVWDCCAASGGKSIMLYDIDPKIDLTVSDVRESILINLKKRFKEAGITNYKSFVADLSANSKLKLPRSNFQLVVGDVPCSGSGTWGRTPEQLFYFDENRIEHYARLQRSIISNVVPHLETGGYLLYITCSVFKKENEEMIEFIRREFSLELVRQEVLKGYDEKADTMFAALLTRK